LHREGKICKGAMYVQAASTKVMATATICKAALFNMLILMTTLKSQVTIAEAQEYLTFCQGEELKKLRKRLAADEERDLQLQADQE
jgi:cobalamin biosynthesis protein CobD/CbiB